MTGHNRCPAAALGLALVAAAPLAAQDDWTAGLFTEACQLPMVSQSVVLRISGGEARVELTQVFANSGPELAQADYRLHLPSDATVIGFGFWNDGRYLAASLQERDRARQEHARAAGAGHATGLLQRDGTIHSFTVFPVIAGGLQEVSTTIVLPVATERGRSHVRLPVDRFLGRARLSTTVVTHLETSEALRDVGVDGVRTIERTRSRHTAELAFATAQSVEIWWAAEAPPLLSRAEAVPLDDGSSAIQLRLALNDLGAGSARPSEIVLLIDASASMRRRSRALAQLIDRVLDQATVPVRVLAVTDTIREITAEDGQQLVRGLLSNDAAFGTLWPTVEAAAVRAGCASPDRRCVVVTDPQLPGLPAEPALETLFLADADELAHFAARIGPSARVYQPEVEPVAALFALADELVLPVLELRRIGQGGDDLVPVGAPRLQVAAGGLMRVFVDSRSTEALSLELAIDGRSFQREVAIEPLDPDTRAGRAVRRAFFSGRLDDWMAGYRRTRDPELRRQIVDVSLREGIPTTLTALHVASPESVMARTATPAPLLRRVGLVLVLIGAAALTVNRWCMA